MEAWFGLIGAIVGATVAWGLNQITKIIADTRKANRNLNAFAFVCLDRLLKIQNAETRSDNKQRDHEIYLLGSDLDRYRDCISKANSKIRKRHWSIYHQMMRILLEHDLTNLDQVITELEIILGARDES